MKLAGCGALLLTLVWGCGPSSPDLGPPLVDETTIDELELLFPCRHSHEHELRHVEIWADPAAAQQYRDCLFDRQNCDEPFFEGALFFKREFEYRDCKDEDLVSYTVNLKLAPNERPDGGDWQWQRLDPQFNVVEDGAPAYCVNCHEEHCAPPNGYDLRCLPD